MARKKQARRASVAARTPRRPVRNSAPAEVWRPTGSLSRRITRMIAVTAAGSMLTGSLIALYHDLSGVHERIIARAATAVQSYSKTAVAAISLEDQAASGLIVARIAGEAGALSVMLEDERGETLAGFQAPARPPANLDDKAPWQRVLLRKIDEFDLPVIRYQQDLKQSGDYYGSIRLEMPTEPMLAVGVSYLQLFGLITGLVTLLAILITRRMRRQISEPIGALLETMDYVARTQDYSRKVPPDGPDEVGSLIVSFNEMLHQIHSRNLRLDEHRRRLQELVIERTRNFEAAALDAEKSSRAKGDFLARMSHEIRTPMNGVVGMAELLENTGLEQGQQRMLSTMRASADALLEIINDILDFSKIEAGQLQVLQTDFDLHELLEEVCDLLASRAHERGLELVCDIDPRVPQFARGDPIRLRQVVTNLLGNAVKYTEQGHVIVNMTAPSLDKEKLELKIDVTDTGLGIPEEQLETIFEAFTQGDSFETRKHGGTGLGLAITKQLVTILGGDISVVSRLGAGTCFTVTVPLAQAQKQPKVTPWSLTGTSILLVVPHEATARATAALLERAGAKTWTVQTGQRALDQIEIDSFNMIVVDHRINDMTPADLLEKLRAHKASAALPVVLMTSVTASQSDPATANVAADAQLLKPVRPQRLRESIDRALGRTGAPESGQQAAPSSRRLLNLKVLLVEDSPVNREVATGMLQAIGCEVETASDGSIGVECALGRSYDIVLMDCQMPLMDGFEATRRIRAAERANSRPMLPIVAITANALPGDRERCLLAGMNEFISKPFTLKKLQDVLASVTRTEGTVAPAPVPKSGPDPAKGGSVLDAAQIDELRALGRPEFIRQAIDMFDKQAAEKLAELDAAVTAKDLRAMEQAAHALKSSSLSIGGRRFATAAGHCEEAARAGNYPRAASEARCLHAELSALCEALASLDEAGERAA